MSVTEAADFTFHPNVVSVIIAPFAEFLKVAIATTMTPMSVAPMALVTLEMTVFAIFMSAANLDDVGIFK